MDEQQLTSPQTQRPIKHKNIKILRNQSVSTSHAYPQLQFRIERKREKKKHEPTNGVVRAGAEPGGIVVKAAIEDGPGVHELPLEKVGVGVVEPHRLQPAKSDQMNRIKELGFDQWMKRGEGSTLSHDETRRLLLWLEKRRLEIPSDGGLASSLPLPMATGATAALMLGNKGGGLSVVTTWLVWDRGWVA